MRRSEENSSYRFWVREGRRNSQPTKPGSSSGRKDSNLNSMLGNTFPPSINLKFSVLVQPRCFKQVLPTTIYTSAGSMSDIKDYGFFYNHRIEICLTEARATSHA